MRLPLKMRAHYLASRYLPFLKLKPPQVDRGMVMTLRPVRNSKISFEKRETGETLLVVPQGQKAGRLTRIVSKWLQTPKERKVELDELGSYVWELCDGNLTIESIVQRTGKAYRLNRREAEVSVTMFMQMLHERNFIGFYKKVGKKKGNEGV